jgi:hypothetical protein
MTWLLHAGPDVSGIDVKAGAVVMAGAGCAAGPVGAAGQRGAGRGARHGSACGRRGNRARVSGAGLV